MEKFRVISDIHLDINDKYPLSFDDDVFTVICGDTSGYPKMTAKWVKKNIKRGIGVSGNHLPYNDDEKTVQELREELAKEFPKESDFTYLDVETGCYKKVVDGILFLGTCFYSNMRITSNYYPEGDINDNKLASFRHMNDYRWGIKEKKYYLGKDNEPTLERITPEDYVTWSTNAFNMFEKELKKNESLKNPKPVVIVTHYPLVKKVVANSFYVDDDNWASYGNEMEDWLKSHPSIKCHCCGHCHDMAKDFRSFKLKRDDGTSILIVNNSRGYVSRAHDATFNPNRFVNVKTWEIEEIPESEEVRKKKEERYSRYLAAASCFF